MSVILTSEQLIIANGETSSGLTADQDAEIDVLSGGKLTDSLATNYGAVFVDVGGSVAKTSATQYGDIWVNGFASEITAEDCGQFDIDMGGSLKTGLIRNKGYGAVYADASAEDVTISGGGLLVLQGGSADKTVVFSGGSFTVQVNTAMANSTTVLAGGTMRIVSAGNARHTTVDGGSLEILAGTESGMIVQSGAVNVQSGGTVQTATLNGGTLSVAGTADGTVINGGEASATASAVIRTATLNGGTLIANGAALTGVSVNSGAAVFVSGGTVESAAVNGGSFEAASVSVTGAEVKGGAAVFAGVSVDGLTVGSAGSATLDSASVVVGKATFEDGATVSFNGSTVAFDTAVAKADDAQIRGLSAADGTAVYTLTAGVDVGVYLLATGADGFNSDIAFGEYTLRLDEEPIKIGDLVYSLTLEGGDLGLSIAEYVEPTPGVVSLAYANSEWAGFADGTAVTVGGVTAHIGTDAFATGDAATAAVSEAEDGKVRVAGGKVSFASGVSTNTTVYSGAEITNSDVTATGKLTVNKGATLTGKAAFAAGASITINGTVVFDTAYATSDSAQYTLAGIPDGKATFTLNAADPKAGTYLLLAGLSSFEDEVAFGDHTLTVGGEAVTVDGLDYSLSIGTGNVLTLSIAPSVPPEDAVAPTVTNVKASTTAPTNQNVTVTAVFADDVALASSLYRIGDAAEWTAYPAGGVTMTDNGTVYFKAVDAAGNESAVASYVVSNIDRIPPTAPTASADITETTDQDVTVSAVFSEDSAKKEYSLDGTAWSAYKSPIVFTDNGIVYFRGTDAAGNDSTVTGYTVSNIEKTVPEKDTTPPTVTGIAADITGPTNQDVTVTAVFSDDVALQSSLYRIGDSSDWHDYPAGGVTMTDNGTVYFKAIDEAGNESAVASYVVSNIDKVPPEAPTASADITETTNKNVTVTAVFSEDSAAQEYSFDLTAWTAYTVPLLFTDNGVVYFRGTDLAGNTSDVFGYTVSNIDKSIPEDDTTPPVVFNVTANITVPTDQNVVVTAEFSDDVELASSLYRIGDAGDWCAYVDGVIMTENGTVYFKAIDAAGNESEIVGYTVSNIEKVVPEKDTTPPTVTNVRADVTKPTNKAVQVMAVFSDDVELASSLYRIGDAGDWCAYADGVVMAENGTVYFKAVDAAGNESEIVGYTVSNIDKTLPDGQATVFVNPEWANLASGTVVETYNGDHATVGVNAFGTADEGNAAVDATGTIHLDRGTVSFSEAARNVVVHEADLAVDNEAGLDNVRIVDSGSISMTKGIMTNCKVLNGRLTVESGAIVDGLTHDSPSGIDVAVNGATVKNAVMGCQMILVDMDYTCSMSVAGEGGLAQNVEVVKGGHLIVSSGGRAESVVLSGDTENYLNGNLTVTDGGAASGVIVSSGGYLNGVYNVSVNDVTVMSGGYASFEQASIGNAVVSGGVLGIGRSASVQGVTLGAGGSMWLANSAGIGTARDTEVQSGAAVDNAGYMSHTVILNGGTMTMNQNSLAENTEVQSGGSLVISNWSGYYSPVARDLEVKNGGVVQVVSKGALTGNITFEEGAAVTMDAGSILEFDLSGLDGTATKPLVNDFSFIGAETDLVLAVSPTQADGTYLLAGGVTAFDRGVMFGEYTLTLGAGPVVIDGVTYSLGLAESVLSLTVSGSVKVDNGPDDGRNNVLWDQKAKTPNMDIYNGDALVIDGGTTDVFIDIQGSVSVERADGITYNNFFGRITGQGFNPDTDPADYRKISLATGARLSFSVTAQAAGKFAIYRIDESWNEKKEITEYKLKSLQSTKVSVKKDELNCTVDTKAVYLEAGTYFLAMEGTIDKRKDTEGFYNVEMHYVDPAEDKKNQSTKFYTDDDDGTNNWVYNKKDKENPVNPAVYGSDPFIINEDTNHVQVDAAGTVCHEDEYGFTWENFVGFGDDTDFVRIGINDPASLCFTIQATGAAKMTVYCLETGMDKNEKPTYKLKALQTTSLKKQKFEIGEEGETFEMYVASTKDLLLDRPADNQEYYIAVQSTNAKKGDEVYYSIIRGVSETHDCVFYTDGDNGWNNYVYDKNLGYNEENVGKFVDNEIKTGGESILLDSPAVDGGWKNFVGFGDATDFAKITVAAGTTLSFALTATDAAKFTIWSLETGVGKDEEPTYKMKALQSTSLKKDKTSEEGLFIADTKDYTFTEAGTYFISMESTNAKKGSLTYYNVELKNATFSETASLDMPELSGGLGPNSGDVLASVGFASGIDTFAEPDGKGLWQNIAGLA